DAPFLGLSNLPRQASCGQGHTLSRINPNSSQAIQDEAVGQHFPLNAGLSKQLEQFLQGLSSQSLSFVPHTCATKIKGRRRVSGRNISIFEASKPRPVGVRRRNTRCLSDGIDGQ